MTQMVFQIVSATNYNEKVLNIFHKFSRNVVGWESTQYAVTPIQVLFKLESLSFVTEIYIHPKLYKSVKALEIFVSDDSFHFQSIAKIYDFTEGIRVQISLKCQYIKFVVLQKQYGKAASIDFLRIYGHQYLKDMQMKSVHSKKKDKISQLLIELGMKDKVWDVDETTLITLYDMSKLKEDYVVNNEGENLEKLLKDLEKVIDIGEKIKKKRNQIKYLNAKQQYKKIKDLSDQIKLLQQRRDHYDEKYQTSRFQQMISLGDETNHDKVLRELLEQDKRQLQRMRRERQRKAQEEKEQIDKQYEELQQEQWWKKQNQLDKIIPQQPKKKQKKEIVQKKQPVETFNFDNPYVYNQGDADMQKFLKPFLQQMGGGYFGDPEVLRKYQQLDYLDVLGARIWVAAHSQNWRQRAAAVQVVLDFSQSKLPERYKNGNTRNLFLALMEFARIMAQDKVLQIYYTSLKIMVVALAPPICGQDVPPTLINKSIQKFITIIIEKISQMNNRAKEISKNTLVTVFKHKAADINIAINECLKVCKPDLNIKFIPLEKQNPRIILSRLQIIQMILKQFPTGKKGVNYEDILNFLIEGSLHHNQIDIREKAIQVLGLIHSLSPHSTMQWYKREERKFKPAVLHQIQAILHIK